MVDGSDRTLPWWIKGMIGAVALVLFWQIGTAFGQTSHIERFTQHEDSAEVCTKRGNQTRCEWFGLEVWDTVRIEVPIPSPAETIAIYDTVPDPETEAALAECQNALGICQANLADALRLLDSLSNVPPTPPETVPVFDTVPDPETEAALAECQNALGVCSADLGATLEALNQRTEERDSLAAVVDSLENLPPPPPDTTYLPCDCDTIPVPPDTTPPPPDTTPPPPAQGDSVALTFDDLMATITAWWADRGSATYAVDGRKPDGTRLIWEEGIDSLSIAATVAREQADFDLIIKVQGFTGGAWDGWYDSLGAVTVPALPAPPDTTPPIPPDTVPPVPPDTGGVASWPLGTNPYTGHGLQIYGSRVDYSVTYHPATSSTPTGFLVTWPGGSQQTDMGWIDLPVGIWHDPYGNGQPPPAGYIAVTDTICVAPGAVGGPYDMTEAVCASRRDMRY
jgi:hypothetical protein